MILTFIFLVLSTFTGFIISRFFIGKIATKIELFLVSYILGLTIAGYSILLLSLIFKDFKIGTYLFLFISFFVCSFFLKHAGLKKNFGLQKILNYFKKLPYLQIIFLIFVIIIFLDIASKTLIFNRESYKVAAAGYGDIPLHMTQVSYFAFHKPFGLEDPIFMGEKLAYPFLINLLSASFLILNGNFAFSFHLPSWSLVISGFILLYLLISRIIKRPLAKICSFLIFFLGSGIGFIKVLQDKNIWLQSGIPDAFYYLLHLPYSVAGINDAKYPDQNNIWTSFLTMFLAHQRSFFFGFSLGVLCLFVIYLAYIHKEKKLFYFAGIIVGLLPLVHAHTFVAVCIIMLGFLLVHLFYKQRDIVIGFATSIVTSSIIALPSIIYLLFFKPYPQKNFLMLRLGWMTEQNSVSSIIYNPLWKIHIVEYLSYMWQNFGIMIPALAITVIYFIFNKKIETEKRRFIYSLILSALMLWIFINIIKLQPWDYDNNKVFGYFLIIFSLIMGIFFDHINFIFSKLLTIILTLSIILTGSIDYLQRSSLANPTLYQIFGDKEIAAADWIKKNVPQDKNILTSDTHLNPVNCLAGKPVLVGYPGWLWTRGIDYQLREEELKLMFSDPKASSALFKKYNIKYIFVGATERNNYHIKQPLFDNIYSIVFRKGDIKIYKIN